MLPWRNQATGSNALELKNPKDDVHPEPMDILVYETAPLGRDQVMYAIGKLVSALDRDRVVRQLAEGTSYSLKDFCSHYPESFDGRGDHISVENWLNDVGKLLATIGCTNE